ncbi:hypothetical protein NG798_24855 [Ancylothrix sp. C2]|nr:hypothetical protein [Ancylothrix sp. D3o]
MKLVGPVVVRRPVKSVVAGRPVVVRRPVKSVVAGRPVVVRRPVKFPKSLAAGGGGEAGDVHFLYVGLKQP